MTHSMPYGYDRLPDMTIDLIHDYMARYPLFALLDTIAQRDPTTRFEMRVQDAPEAKLEVPRYEAILRAAGGRHGLTLYAHAPREHKGALFHWLIHEIDAMGVEVPQGLLALVSE